MNEPQINPLRRTRSEAVLWDVVVLGGGSAGLAAAVAAARAGARTLLVERHGYCGGMGTAALVHSFCGLYLLRREPGAVLANDGLPLEIAERMIAAEKQLTPYFHTEIISIHREAAGAWGVTLANRGGQQKIRTHALIDASGDAIAAQMLAADAAITESPRLQRPAYVFAIHGVEPGRDPNDALHIAGLIVQGIRANRLEKAALGITFRASGRKGETFATIDLAGGEAESPYNPCDTRTLTDIEIHGRQTAMAVVQWLREQHHAWKHAYISHWPARAGIRESRRWIGEKILTGDDIRSGNRFDDEVALATWPMEFRENTRGPKLIYPTDDLPCGIPLACLRPRGIDHLWIAGRCISCDHDAQASIRVMGTCFATGEAAGRAAAREANAIAS